MHLFAMVKTGSSYLSQSELPLTFGLGKPKEQQQRLTINVVWPSGRKETVPHVKGNQFVVVEEGKGIISEYGISFAAK